MADYEQEKLLPVANVGRIMKQILPSSARISKEAKQTMQECATEFISFVTGEASDKCHKENRKTVIGDDICWALSTLGLDNYAEAIIRYFYKYREAEMKKVNSRNKGSTSQEREEDDREEDDDDEEPIGNGHRMQYEMQTRVFNRGESSIRRSN